MRELRKPAQIIEIGPQLRQFWLQSPFPPSHLRVRHLIKHFPAPNWVLWTYLSKFLVASNRNWPLSLRRKGMYVEAILTTSSSKPMRRNADNRPTPDHPQLQEKRDIWTFMYPGQMHHLWCVLVKIMSPNLIKLLTQRPIFQKCRGQRTCQIKLWDSNQPRPHVENSLGKLTLSLQEIRGTNLPPTHTHTQKKEGKPLQMEIH